jgi:hypothetical protein
MASSIPISKWQAAVRKPDHPPAPSDLRGMMYSKGSTKVTPAQHRKSAVGQNGPEGDMRFAVERKRPQLRRPYFMGKTPPA